MAVIIIFNQGTTGMNATTACPATTDVYPQQNSVMGTVPTHSSPEFSIPPRGLWARYGLQAVFDTTALLQMEINRSPVAHAFQEFKLHVHDHVF